MQNEIKPRYIIESAYQTGDLAEKVSAKILEGYTPCGGPWNSGAATHQALYMQPTLSVSLENNWCGGPR